MNDVKNLGLIAVGLVLLQACSPSVPASNAGPGFNDYAEYELERARRESALAGNGSTTFQAPVNVQSTPIGQTVPSTPIGQSVGVGSSDLAAAGIGQSALSAPLQAPMSATSTAPIGTVASAPVSNNTGISDEQDFDAVASRETIQSDAARRAQQAAMREQIMPTAVPTRTGQEGANIVEYALKAPNRKGQEWYSRSIFATEGKYQRNCAKYTSPDAAQRDFLGNGGPDRDRMGLDPDGDGFACGWDPAPFLVAAGR